MATVKKLNAIIDEERKLRKQRENELVKVKAELERKSRLVSKYKNLSNVSHLAVIEARNNNALPIVLQREEQLRKQLEFNLNRLKESEEKYSILTKQTDKLNNECTLANDSVINYQMIVSQLNALIEEKAEANKALKCQLNELKSKKGNLTDVLPRYSSSLKNAIKFGKLLIKKKFPLANYQKLWISNAQKWVQELKDAKFKIDDKSKTVDELVELGIDKVQVDDDDDDFCELSDSDDLEDQVSGRTVNDSGSVKCSSKLIEGKLREINLTSGNTADELICSPSSSLWTDEGISLSPQFSLISHCSSSDFNYQSKITPPLSCSSGDSGINLKENSKSFTYLNNTNKNVPEISTLDTSCNNITETNKNKLSDSINERTSDVSDANFPAKKSSIKDTEKSQNNKSVTVKQISIFDPESVKEKTDDIPIILHKFVGKEINAEVINTLNPLDCDSEAFDIDLINEVEVGLEKFCEEFDADFINEVEIGSACDNGDVFDKLLSCDVDKSHLIAGDELSKCKSSRSCTESVETYSKSNNRKRSLVQNNIELVKIKEALDSVNFDHSYLQTADKNVYNRPAEDLKDDKVSTQYHKKDSVTSNEHDASEVFGDHLYLCKVTEDHSESLLTQSCVTPSSCKEVHVKQSNDNIRKPVESANMPVLSLYTEETDIVVDSVRSQETANLMFSKNCTEDCNGNSINTIINRVPSCEISDPKLFHENVSHINSNCILEESLLLDDFGNDELSNKTFRSGTKCKTYFNSKTVKFPSENVSVAKITDDNSVKISEIVSCEKPDILSHRTESDLDNFIGFAYCELTSSTENYKQFKNLIAKIEGGKRSEHSDDEIVNKIKQKTSIDSFKLISPIKENCVQSLVKKQSNRKKSTKLTYVQPDDCNSTSDIVDFQINTDIMCKNVENNLVTGITVTNSDNANFLDLVEISDLKNNENVVSNSSDRVNLKDNDCNNGEQLSNINRIHLIASSRNDESSDDENLENLLSSIRNSTSLNVRMVSPMPLKKGKRRIQVANKSLKPRSDKPNDLIIKNKENENLSNCTKTEFSVHKNIESKSIFSSESIDFSDSTLQGIFEDVYCQSIMSPVSTDDGSESLISTSDNKEVRRSGINSENFVRDGDEQVKATDKSENLTVNKIKETHHSNANLVISVGDNKGAEKIESVYKDKLTSGRNALEAKNIADDLSCQSVKMTKNESKFKAGKPDVSNVIRPVRRSVRLLSKDLKKNNKSDNKENISKTVITKKTDRQKLEAGSDECSSQKINTQDSSGTVCSNASVLSNIKPINSAHEIETKHRTSKINCIARLTKSVRKTVRKSKNQIEPHQTCSYCSGNKNIVKTLSKENLVCNGILDGKKNGSFGCTNNVFSKHVGKVETVCTRSMKSKEHKALDSWSIPLDNNSNTGLSTSSEPAESSQQLSFLESAVNLVTKDESTKKQCAVSKSKNQENLSNEPKIRKSLRCLMKKVQPTETKCQIKFLPELPRMITRRSKLVNQNVEKINCKRPSVSPQQSSDSKDVSNLCSQNNRGDNNLKKTDSEIVINNSSLKVTSNINNSSSNSNSVKPRKRKSRDTVDSNDNYIQNKKVQREINVKEAESEIEENRLAALNKMVRHQITENVSVNDNVLLNSEHLGCDETNYHNLVENLNPENKFVDYDSRMIRMQQDSVKSTGVTCSVGFEKSKDLPSKERSESITGKVTLKDGFLRTAYNFHRKSLIASNSTKWFKKKLKEAKNAKVAEDLLSKIQELFVNSAPLTSDHLVQTVNGLKSCSQRSVAEMIVDLLCVDETSPIVNTTPPLTSFQKYLFPVVYQLCQAPNYPNFLLTMLSSVKRTLFSSTEVCLVHPSQNMTRFVTVLSRSLGAFEEMRWFMFDVLYMCRYKAIPIIFTMLTLWSDLMTHSQFAKDCPVSICISHALISHQMDPKSAYLYKGPLLKKILNRLHEYQFGEMTTDQVLEKILSMISIKGFVEAMILLCKREGCEWTMDKVIKNKLFPMFQSWRNGVIDDKTIITVIITLGFVMRPFPVETSEPIICDATNELSSILESQEAAPEVQEAAALSVFRLSRFSFNRSVRILRKWKPKTGEVSKHVIDIMKPIIAKKKPVWWQKCFIGMIDLSCDNMYCESGK